MKLHERMLSSLKVLFVVFTLGICVSVCAQGVGRATLEKEIDSLHEQLTQKESLFLLPSAADQTLYREFLSQADTGLCRLLPRETYETKLMIRGGGSYYSFTHLSNDYNRYPDIGLDGGQLYTSFAGADLGLIASIGDVPLESVDASQATAAFLLAYPAPNVEREARAEYERVQAGPAGGGFVFRRQASAELNTTYVMRAIHYYDRSDVVAAFRVVSKDPDGSITLLWKILKKGTAPQLVRSEPEP